MANHILFWNAEFRGDNRLHSLRVLRWSPRRDFSVLELRQCHHRFHRSVGQQRNVVVGFKHIRGGKWFVGVAHAADELPWLVRCLPKIFLVFNGVVRFVRPVVPGYLQLLATLERSPSVMRNHRNATQRLERSGRFKWIDTDGLVPSRNLQGFLIVKSFYLSPEDWRTFDRRVYHAIKARIHSIHRSAGAEVFKVRSEERR